MLAQPANVLPRRALRRKKSLEICSAFCPVHDRVKPTKSDSTDRRTASGDALLPRTALIVLCFVTIVGAFAALAIWQARMEVFERKQDVARDIVQSVESIVDRVSLERSRLLPLVGIPCASAQPRLMASDAFIPYVRNSALVAHGVIYCVSSYGTGEVPLDAYFDEVDRSAPSYRLIHGSRTQPGRPALLVFFPVPVADALGSGILFYIDGAYLADVLHDDARFGMDYLELRSGKVSLTLRGSSDASTEPPTAVSQRFPFDVVVHASPTLVNTVYRHQLSLLVPIGIAFAALVAWLTSIRSRRAGCSCGPCGRALRDKSSMCTTNP